MPHYKRACHSCFWLTHYIYYILRHHYLKGQTTVFKDVNRYKFINKVKMIIVLCFAKLICSIYKKNKIKKLQNFLFYFMVKCIPKWINVMLICRPSRVQSHRYEDLNVAPCSNYNFLLKKLLIFCVNAKCGSLCIQMEGILSFKIILFFRHSSLNTISISSLQSHLFVFFLALKLGKFNYLHMEFTNCIGP